MTDAEELMDFLASPEAMELPDQIEEVNAKQLDKLVQEKMFVAVFFCKFISQDNRTYVSLSSSRVFTNLIIYQTVYF